MADLAAAQAALAVLRGAGVTQAEIARELGVSTRMLRHVAAGTKGANLTGPLQQLANVGRVTAPVPRREQRVRAPGGTTRQVSGTTPTGAVSGRRTHTSSTTYTRGGKLVHITAPKSRGWGRAQAGAQIVTELRNAVSGRRRWLSFSIDVLDPATGRERHIAWARHRMSTLRAARDAEIVYGGDGWAWLAAQFEGTQYEELIGRNGENIVGVELEFTNA